MIRRTLIVAASAMVLVLACAGTTALAADRYGTPGTGVALSQTTCAGAGAFGAFGPGNNWGQNPPGASGPSGHGANGPLTGSNNANLCGNPMGNP
jgi:hypothetical protein